MRLRVLRELEAAIAPRGFDGLQAQDLRDYLSTGVVAGLSPATVRKHRNAMAIERWLRLRELSGPDHDRPWLSLHTEAHYAKPMRHRQFEMLLRNIGTGWEYHRMRHTCGTELLRAGMPLESVSRLLGHARLQQTLAYAELLDEDVVNAALRAEHRFGRTMRRRPDEPEVADTPDDDLEEVA